ncbi:Uncharacterised protein [Streptococcus pseudoporcinus]|nr:hypothetical protein [Streptococcus pseudoporcinus]VTS20286.1 Uncharacterised protein [Streptococcus pseudoporcinus]VUC69510.1 Uncharacterised protein [Streptococcus pseudoporcinus]VUC99886.1 Uncharacterised protein [Streptococcus pseudoporcinus]VUD00280.1 Uncharacterised protein [Streptococcus pseudoporcinus]
MCNYRKKVVFLIYMKKKLLFVSALALLTTGIALSAEKTVSASSNRTFINKRLSSLSIKNILDEYDRQINWDVSTYNSIYRYWRIQVWQYGKTASDMREELDKALPDNNR